MGITDEKIQEYMYRKCLIDTVVECVGEEHV